MPVSCACCTPLYGSNTSLTFQKLIFSSLYPLPPKNLLGRPLRLVKPRRNPFSNPARSSSSAVPAVGHQKTFTPAFLLVAAVGMVVADSKSSRITYNHCQVPCGIFDDPAVVGELRQACTTIRKAMRSSRALHQTMGSDLLSFNQMVRWVDTKEEHCSMIISRVSEYCLCQRVKRVNFASESDYLQALKIHHTVMQAAMKAKQSVDEQDCIALEHAVEDLAKMYTK